MRTSFPLIDSLSASQTPVHFNLGTIGCIQSLPDEGGGPWVLPSRDFHAGMVEVTPSLPRPGRDLEAKLLRVPLEAPLVLLAARHHTVAYYFICDVSEPAAFAALKAANKVGRLEIGFIAETGLPDWSALHLQAKDRASISEALAARDAGAPRQGRLWRQKLGMLLLSLPALLDELGPTERCFHHTAVLLSGAGEA